MAGGGRAGEGRGAGSAAIPPLETAQFAGISGILSRAMTTMEAQACPSCNTDLPINPGYVTWCHQCGWNLSPPTRETPTRRLDRLYDRVGRRLGDQLVGELLAVERLELFSGGPRRATGAEWMIEVVVSPYGVKRSRTSSSSSIARR